jgi:hypothetical protein
MEEIKCYSKYGPLHTTIGILEGLKDVDPKIDPYYMEECDMPDKPNGFKLLVSEPIRF